eukprot:scaffold2923_cov112-Isochrysis_galbana.AAC.6
MSRSTSLLSSSGETWAGSPEEAHAEGAARARGGAWTRATAIGRGGSRSAAQATTELNIATRRPTQGAKLG